MDRIGNRFLQGFLEPPGIDHFDFGGEAGLTGVIDLLDAGFGGLAFEDAEDTEERDLLAELAAEDELLALAHLDPEVSVTTEALVGGFHPGGIPP